MGPIIPLAFQIMHEKINARRQSQLHFDAHVPHLECADGGFYSKLCLKE